VTAEKVSKTLTPGGNVIKIYFFITDEKAQKARGFACGNPFQPGLRI
jgi:hypothetical protein